MVYQLAFIIIALIGLLSYGSASNPNSKKNIKKYSLYIALILIFQSGFRNVAVGPDTFAYYITFNTIMDWSWQELFDNFSRVYIDGIGKDPGYPILQKIIQIIFPNYRIYLLIIATFIFLTLSKLVRDNIHSISEVFVSYLIYLLLFYNFISITGIRQSLAITIGIWCYYMLKNKNYLLYLILVVIAFTIHKSAIILITFPLILNTSTQQILRVSLILGIFALVFREDLVMMSSEEAGYDNYFEAETPWKSIILFSLVSIAVVAQYIFRKSAHDNIELVKLFLPTIIMIPLLGNDSIFTREAYYFSIFAIVLIPQIVSNIFHDAPLYKFALCFALCIQVLLLTGDYAFMWEEMKLGHNYKEYSTSVSTLGI